MEAPKYRKHTVWVFYFVKRCYGLPVWSHLAVLLCIPLRGYFMIDLVSSRGARRDGSRPRAKRRFMRVRITRLLPAGLSLDDRQLARLVEITVHARKLLPHYEAALMHVYTDVDQAAVLDALRWLGRIGRQSRFAYRVWQRSCMSFGAELLQRLGLPVTKSQLFLMDPDGAISIVRRTRRHGWQADREPSRTSS